MMPSIFGENLFDEFFNEPFAIMAPQGHNPLYGKRAKNLMKTDVRETENSYEWILTCPVLRKMKSPSSLKEGCLNISAAKGLDKEESDKEGKYIRQERYAGSCSRSFYVGTDIDPTQVTAKFENGILCISVPKASRQLPARSTVEIK